MTADNDERCNNFISEILQRLGQYVKIIKVEDKVNTIKEARKRLNKLGAYTRLGY